MFTYFEKKREENKKQSGLAIAFALMLVVLATVLALSISYNNYKEDNVYFKVTVNGKGYECANYQLSDEDIVLYKLNDDYTNIFDSKYIVIASFDIESKSDVEIQRSIYEDSLDFNDWFSKLLENDEIEWGK